MLLHLSWISLEVTTNWIWGSAVRIQHYTVCTMTSIFSYIYSYPLLASEALVSVKMHGLGIWKFWTFLIWCTYVWYSFVTFRVIFRFCIYHTWYMFLTYAGNLLCLRIQAIWGVLFNPTYITFSIKNIQYYQQCCLEHTVWLFFLGLQLEEFS